MKKLVMACFLFISLFVTTLNVQAYPYINIISQSCSTQGGIRWYNGNYSWDKITGTTSVAVIGPVGTPWDGRTVAAASADVGESTAHLKSFAWLDDGYANAELEFRAIGASYINIFAEQGFDGGAHGSVGLIDVTTSEQLLALSGSPSKSFQDSFAIDPSHTYLLSTKTLCMYQDASESQVSISLVGVPEPSTMLFLGLGLMGLAGVRRKFRK